MTNTHRFHVALRKLSRLASLFLPRGIHTRVESCAKFILGSASQRHSISVEGAYRVSVPSVLTSAPKVVHVIANFMTGGSSRLVVDLIEHLGADYRQVVLTSYIPTPPAYIGLDIEECRFPSDCLPFLNYFEREKPNIVHIHYWGDCDEPWYAKAVEAAESLNLLIIQNINTPVHPFLSNKVAKYVYVSDYVRRVFGDVDNPKHVTIYPGSNFELFAPVNGTGEAICVGMVYRLERDKLNDDSIWPFIRIAQLRPQTRILIVGGGSLLKLFQQTVADNGVAENFEFTGYVAYDELPLLYQRMSIFIAPVWKESFGQVSPFAMNMGIPVIGYDVGAIGEIVDDSRLLAKAGDFENLARIAIRLLDDSSERKTVSIRHRGRAQNYFSIEAMIESYAELYKEVEKESAKVIS